ncbi:hypothetical protein TI39_contig494g00007 [Zymoseptoria brevis]|uniref:Uncharacterized protein n=1 Tax=Zymoseptoria brevis TaxID=1047168 RepID=A0A0F4GK10_9PEZI|nr:hypothetical protein TI39_contig494g00007 [Zymoseptoria brevis]
MDKNREDESEWLLVCKAFQGCLPERWAIAAMLPHVEEMFEIPPTFQGNDRRQLARKFAKVILNSFDRCVNWNIIEQTHDATGEAGSSDVDIQDRVGEEDKGDRTSKHAAADSNGKDPVQPMLKEASHFTVPRAEAGSSHSTEEVGGVFEEEIPETPQRRGKKSNKKGKKKSKKEVKKIRQKGMRKPSH